MSDIDLSLELANEILLNQVVGPISVGAGVKGFPLNIAFPMIPLVAISRGIFADCSFNISANAAADYNQLQIDAMDIEVDLFGGDGTTFLASITLVAQTFLPLKITSPQGQSLSTLKGISLKAGMQAGPGTVSFAQVQCIADITNTDAANPHSFNAFGAVLYGMGSTHTKH